MDALTERASELEAEEEIREKEFNFGNQAWIRIRRASARH